MRDFLVVAIVLGSVPLILVRPQIGIIMWFWLGMMNPHRMAWGYAQEFRVALVVGIATLIAWVGSRDTKTPPNLSITYALAAFTFWVTLATVCAILPDVAWPKWEEIIKILLMTFITMCIVQDRSRINQLVWVIVLSLGFFGVKGGLFAIATGGSYRVWGPDNSFIADNNSLALALIVILPLMQYLRINAPVRWVRLGVLGAMGLTIIAILASYSRGALIGIVLTLGALLIKARHRFITMVVAAGVLGFALTMMPDQWFERMNTIQTYQQDDSAQGRLEAWTFAFKLALDHPFVGGGELIGRDDALYKHYVPTAAQSRAAHSIYFEVLGETGFVGLGIFLWLLAASWFGARKVIRTTRGRPDLAWAGSLAAMLQVSVLGYAVTGAFLSLGFFDLYYALVALVAVLQLVVQRELAKATVQSAVTPAPTGALSGYSQPAPALARVSATGNAPPRLLGA